MNRKTISLLLTLVLSLFVWQTATAATGWYSDYIKLNVNGTGVTGPTGYYWIGSDPSYGTSLVVGLGNVTSLKLDGADMKYWGDGADRTGGSFFYEVKSADGVTTYKAATEVIWTQTSLGGNDFQGISSGLNVDLLAGIPSGTACKLTVWAKSWGGAGDSWLTNSGANYVATFTSYNVLVSGSASQDGGYSTLGAAITAIGTTQPSQNIEIKIGASTTEATTGITIGAGTWNSLKIYPIGTATIGASLPNTSTTAFITLSGANKVTIDGRLNQTGASSLTIVNNSTATANTTGSTIIFDNNAQNNTVKYCTIKGSQTGNFGIISFSATATTTNGNGLNTIDHNVITLNGTTPPKYGIYAIGNTSFPNLTNTISNNEFKDLIAVYVASTCLFIAGGTSAVQNNNFTISGNSFYNTAMIDNYASSNLTRILLGIGTSSALYGGSHTITDNYFGGSAANCVGTLQKRYKEATLHIMAIYPSNGTTSIQNNTIKNISWSNDYYAASMNGINIAGGTGDVNIGTITGNTIGDNTTTGSFTFIAKGASNVSATLISISTTGTVNCQNNKIGSFTAQHQTTGQTIGVTAISKSAGAGTTNISNNVIGSLTTANSIYSYNTVAAGSQSVSGISCSGTGTCTVSNNAIANLTNNTTTGYVYGINMGGATTSGTANGNLIHSNVITGATGTGANIGISSGAGTNTISNNIIRLGDNNACEIRGINDGSGATSTSSYHNTIYIGGSPTSGAFNSSCEFSSGPATIKFYKNNILVNARSNNGALGSHYALYLNTTNTGTLGVDGNDYYVSGTGGILGRYSTDKTTLLALQTSTAQDASSINVDPSFANAGGTTAESYVPSYLSLTGLDLLSTVSTDYNGVSRTTTPTMGTIDYRIWNGSAWNTAPTTDYNARIDGTYTGAGFACRNLVLNAGKQLGISSGTLAVANNFTILSNAANGTGTFTNTGTLTVGGATTVQQYITSTETGVNGRNWYISSPLSAALSNTITSATGNGLVYYDGTTNWPTAGTTMEVMKGYIAKSPAQNTTINFTGGTLNIGDQSVTDLPLGFNLVGNPYPSYVDFAQAIKTNVTNSIWYRSKKTGSYNFHTYNVTGGIGINDGTAIIPPMQSFWIKTTSATNTFGFTNDMRSHQDQSLINNRLKLPKANIQQLVRLQVSNAANRDETVIYFNPAAQNTVDEYDTQKMFNNISNVPEIFTQVGSENLVINGMNSIPYDTEMPLGFVTGETGDFSISRTEMTNFESGTRIVLKDKLNPTTEFELAEGVSYSFSSKPTKATTDRFSLIFRAPGTTTGVKTTATLNTQVFVNAANQIAIIAPEKSNYAIYNSVGQLVENGILNSEPRSPNSKLNSGMYVVKVSENGNELTTKVIIK